MAKELRAYNGVALDSNGDPVASASVEVRNQAAALVTIYSDEAGTVSISNPLTADSRGMFSFFVADGRYQIKVVGDNDSELNKEQIVFIPAPTVVGSVMAS